MFKSSIDQLRELTSKKWESLKKADVKSLEEKEKIANLLNPNGTKLFDSDCDFIVFGSLARNEFTEGSDLDWTLLVDGQAKPDHQDIVVELRKIFSKEKYNAPGTTGTFGGLAFSHDIIHHIGGLEDDNRNTTRRILLLLESSPISTKNNSIVYKNVIKNVLKRYLKKSYTTTDIKFPRFLLNDIVRYWRLMCVDFAAKEWEEREHKWVLRNVKLRFSRKLLFVAGMLICYSFYERSKKGNIDQDEEIEYVLNEYVLKTPLEILAAFCVKNNLKDIGEKLFDSYNYFITVLENQTNRKHLGDLSPKDIIQDQLYLELRGQSHNYQDALTEMFFNTETLLKEFTIKFGVF